MGKYTREQHKIMIDDRIFRVDSFSAECPCGWHDKYASREGAGTGLISHYRERHRWSEDQGEILLCGKDVGSRPYWMSPDQYDPCRCRLLLHHDGGCACQHTLEEGAVDGST